MKILYITNGITGSGGLERVLSVKLSILAEKLNYEIHIVSLNEFDRKPFFSFSKKITFYPIPTSGNLFSYFKSYQNGIQKVVDQIQPDIISVCDDGLKGFFLPTFIKTRSKWIHESHASIFLGDKGNGVSFLKKIQHQLKQVLGQRFSKIVLLTESNRAEWNLNNLEVIPNPLPFTMNKTSSVLNKKIIAVGSYSYNKGYDLLLKIWSKIEEKHLDWELHIYGNRVQEKLTTLAKDLALNNVLFHRPVNNIEKSYLESSIFVLPSRSEGFGMVIIEAMSCGLPVISFDCPNGPRDIISNTVDGFLVPGDNLMEFEDKINQLIDSAHLRQKMGEAGKETSKKYSPENIVTRWDELFKSLLN